MRKNPYCSRVGCNNKKGLTPINKVKNRTGKVRVYYICSPCRKVFNLKTSKWREINRCRLQGYRRKSRQKLRQRLLDAYGNKCACCGEKEEKFLVVDHKYNDGYLERKKYPNTQMWRFIIKQNFPSRYQLLCYNCNMAKAFYGGCPHKN